MKRLVLFLVAWASLMTLSVQAQWVEAYTRSGAFNGFHFTDTLNGWFTHIGTDKIVHTTDGGFTFQVQQVTAGAYNMYDVYMEDNQTGWCVGSNLGSGPGYIHRTTDGGATWVRKTHPASQSIWGQVEQVGSSIWIIGSYDGPTEYLLILKTSDGGNTWQFEQFPQVLAGYLHIFDAQNFVLYGEGGLLRRTTDGGTTWISAGLPSDYQTELVRFIDQNIGYALVTDFWPSPTDGYLYRTTDGGFTWHLHYSWADLGQKRGLSVIPGTNTIFVGGWLLGNSPLRGILKSTDAGATWDTVLQVFTPKNVTDLYTPSEQHGWAVGNAEIYRYDWEPPVNHSPFFIPPYPDTVAYVDSTYDAMVYADDIDGDTLAFAFLQKPAWLLMVEGFSQTARIRGTPSIADTGWSQISITVNDNRGGADTLSWMLHVIYVPPVNHSPQFVGSWPDTLTIYRDSSYTWHFDFQDMDGDSIFAIAGELGVPGMQVLAGWGIGSITVTAAGQPTDTGWSLANVNVRDEQGALGGLQFWVYVDFVTGVEPIPGIPTEFVLSQNYPNPFNPTTTIAYSIPQASEVRLTVYNLLGQEVEVLVNEYQHLGNYKVAFDGQSLPSGIYFYRLTAGNYTATKKFIILK